MYDQEAPALIFASALCCTFMLLSLSLDSRRDHSGSDSLFGAVVRIVGLSGRRILPLPCRPSF